MDELEIRFEELERELLQMSENQAILDHNFNELVEMKYVLEKASYFFEEVSTNLVEIQLLFSSNL